MRRALRSLILALAALALAACEVISAPLSGPLGSAQTAPAQVSPTPTVPAPVLLQRALAARAAADDSAAAADLSALIQAYPDAPEAAQARYYLAESYALRGRWTSAAELLRVFFEAAPRDEPLRAAALFWLARAPEAAGAHEAAVAAYGQ
ncbi:MAG: tetratricopeptide repeat protein, partial [Chloroflexales bacterium]|nr:tetratricopeptide repeat protein [Chloroflexales bacterium]